MDDYRFDDLARAIGQGSTRRRLLRGGAASGLAWLGWTRHPARAAGQEEVAADTAAPVLPTCPDTLELCQGMCVQPGSCAAGDIVASLAPAECDATTPGQGLDCYQQGFQAGVDAGVQTCAPSSAGVSAGSGASDELAPAACAVEQANGGGLEDFVAGFQTGAGAALKAVATKGVSGSISAGGSEDTDPNRPQRPPEAEASAQALDCATLETELEAAFQAVARKGVSGSIATEASGAEGGGPQRPPEDAATGSGSQGLECYMLGFQGGVTAALKAITTKGISGSIQAPDAQDDMSSLSEGDPPPAATNTPSPPVPAATAMASAAPEPTATATPMSEPTATPAPPACEITECPSGWLFDEATCSCVCIPPACPENWVADETTCTCACVPFACPPNFAFDSANCSCFCAEIACAEGEVFDPASCACVGSGAGAVVGETG